MAGGAAEKTSETIAGCRVFAGFRQVDSPHRRRSERPRPTVMRLRLIVKAAQPEPPNRTHADDWTTLLRRGARPSLSALTHDKSDVVFSSSAISLTSNRAHEDRPKAQPFPAFPCPSARRDLRNHHLSDDLLSHDTANWRGIANHCVMNNIRHSPSVTSVQAEAFARRMLTSVWHNSKVRMVFGRCITIRAFRQRGCACRQAPNRTRCSSAILGFPHYANRRLASRSAGSGRSSSGNGLRLRL